MSTRNAGAKASPAEVPPSRPSKPGTTHHQGSGSNPLNDATNGLSTCRNFRIAYSTQQAITDISRVKAWATRLIPSLKVTKRNGFLLHYLGLATTTNFIFCWLLGFNFALVQMALDVGPIQGTYKPAVGGGHQNAVHITSPQPFEHRLKCGIGAGSRWARLHHFFCCRLGVTVKTINPHSSQYNSPVCGYNTRLLSCPANSVDYVAYPVS